MILLLLDWIDNLPLLSKFYWTVAIPATITFLVQLALSFRNQEIKNKKESKYYQLLTLRNIVGFFMVFSWSGLACIDSGYSDDFAIIVSFFCGVTMMLVMATIFYLMKKLMNSVREGLE